MAERRGRVRVLVNGVVQAQPFVDLRREVKHTGKGGEQGLLSIAFPPDYAASGRFYVAYTDRRDALRVVELRRSAANPLLARRKSARLVIRIPQPTTKHHGGLIAFGPDKSLYIGVGDGGPSGDPRGVAQRKSVLFGKLLRIDPRPGPARPRKRGRPRRAPYTVPSDNPLVGRRGRDEIFAYGLRNPWRFSFDRSPTGDRLTLADVGNDRFEEINILPLSKARGANFGWSHFEGWARFKPGLKRRRTVLPLYRYPTTSRRCSVVGGYVVRDPRLSRIKGREILGRYLFGDFCSNRLFAFRPRPRRAGQERSFRQFDVRGVTSFAQDRFGRIYVLTYDGPVYRIDPARKRVEP